MADRARSRFTAGSVSQLIWIKPRVNVLGSAEFIDRTSSWRSHVPRGARRDIVYESHRSIGMIRTTPGETHVGRDTAFQGRTRSTGGTAPGEPASCWRGLGATVQTAFGDSRGNQQGTRGAFRNNASSCRADRLAVRS